MKLPFLRKERIESEAMGLMREYGRAFDEITAPVPVDEILECHLGLSLDFGDLRGEIGNPDILAATWIGQRRVVVDLHLDPEENPDKLGRYRFTLAHEIGHWQLHRHLFESDPNQTTLFEMAPEPSIVCRSSTKEPMEWQADVFASYLLMPTHLIEAVWLEEHGRSTALQVAAETTAGYDGTIPVQPITRRMAERFHTSNQAMQIRLSDMGLISAASNDPSLLADEVRQ